MSRLHQFSTVLDAIPPSGIRRFFDLVIGAKDIISLGVGEPDFDTPWQIREAGIQSLEQGQTSYTSNQGLVELREEIANYLESRFSAVYDPDQEVLITVGVSEGFDLACRVLLNPGDEVIVHEPNYVCYAPLIRLAGGIPISLDTSDTDLVPDVDRLAALVGPKTRAILLCSPNNPTGAVIPKDRLEKIAKIAKDNELWVISDEIYAELCYDSPYTSFASLPGMKSQTILLSGFSKAFAMTGWRIGYLCAPSEFMARALKIHQYSILCAPIMGQYAAIEALRKSRRDVDKMVRSYLQRRNFFVDALNQMGLKTAMPKGAFYCFVSVKETGLSSEAFALQLLKEQKVAVVPGEAFGPSGQGFIRCCYATSQQTLGEAVNRIEKFLKNLK